MTDLARLGFEVDSRQVTTAKNELTAMGQASRRAATDVEHFESATTQMSRAASGMASVLRQAQYAILGLVSGAVVNSLIKTTMEMQRINLTLGFVAGSAQGAREEFARFSALADSLGQNILETAPAFAQFAAAAKLTGLTMEQTRTTFAGVSAAMLQMGRSSADTQGALFALQQILSKGRVMAEEVRLQFGERLPGALVLAAEAMGMTMREFNEAMEDGRLNANEFVTKVGQALFDRFVPAMQQTTGLATAAMAELDNAFDRLKITVVESGFQDALIVTFERLTQILNSPALVGAARAIGEGFRIAAENIDLLTTAGVALVARGLAPMIMSMGQAAAAQTALATAVASGNAVMIGSSQEAAAKQAFLAAEQVRVMQTAAAAAAVELEYALALKATGAASVDVAGALARVQAAKVGLAAASATAAGAQTALASSMGVLGVAMANLRAAGAAILAMFGGPWGLAITAGAAALYLMATATDEADEAAQRHNETLDTARQRMTDYAKATKEAKEEIVLLTRQELTQAQTEVRDLQRQIDERRDTIRQLQAETQAWLEGGGDAFATMTPTINREKIIAAERAINELNARLRDAQSIVSILTGETEGLGLTMEQGDARAAELAQTMGTELTDSAQQAAAAVAMLNQALTRLNVDLESEQRSLRLQASALREGNIARYEQIEAAQDAAQFFEREAVRSYNAAVEEGQQVKSLTDLYEIAANRRTIAAQTQADLASQALAGAGAATQAFRTNQDMAKSNEAALKALRDALDDTGSGASAAAKATDRLTDAMAAFLELAAPSETSRAADGIETINRLIEQGATDAERYAETVEQVNLGLKTLAEQGITLTAEQQERLNRALQESDPAWKKQTEEAEKAAEAMKAPFETAAENITNAFGDAFESIFTGGVDSFKDLGRTILDIMAKLAAQVATLLVFKPVVGGILGSFGLGDIATGLGAGGGGLGGGFNLGSFGSFFGGSSSGIKTGIAGIDSFLGSYLISPTVAGQTVNAAGTVIPASLSGGLTLGGALSSGLGGFGFGAGISGLMGGNPLIGGAAGGALSLGGSLLGSIFPSLGFLGGPIGMIAGGLLGGLAGGLFKKKPSVGPVLAANFGSSGNFRVGSVDNDASLADANAMGQQFGDVFGELFDMLGGKFQGGFTISTAKGQFRVRLPGDRWPGTWLPKGSTEADVIRYLVKNYTTGGTNADARRAATFSTADDLQQYLGDVQFGAGFQNTLRGLRASADPRLAVQLQASQEVKALTDQFDDFIDKTKELRLNTRDATEAYATHLKVLLGIIEPAELSPMQAALERINTLYSESAALAKRLGISEAQLAAAREDAIDKLRESFSESLGRSINALQGKGYFNDVTDLLEQIETLRTDAEALGVGQGGVDQFFRLAAQQIVDSVGLTGEAFDELIERFPALAGLVREFVADLAPGRIDQTAKSLRDFITSLTFAPGSSVPLADQFAKAQSMFAEQVEAARNGQFNLSDLTGAAQTLLGTGREMYASSLQYATLEEWVRSALESAGAAAGLPGFGSATETEAEAEAREQAHQDAVAVQNELIEIKAVLNQLLAQQSAWQTDEDLRAAATRLAS